MKRIMSVTGLLGGVLACVGVLLKLMHLPMANVCLVVGISFISLIYLPLLLLVKLKEIESTILKIAHVVGILAGMLFGMSVMFKFMHWPYANVMMVITLVIMGLIFMPVYFTHSYKLTENKLSSLAFMAVLLAAVFGLYGLAQPAASKTMDQSLYVMYQTLITDLDRVEQEREEVMRQTAEEWREFNTETSELLDYIKGMRAKSVALTQDVDLAEAENMNLQSMEWGDNAGQLQRMLTDAGSKYNADELEQRLGAWKASAVSAGVSEEKVGHWALTEPVVVEGSKQLSWKEAYFSEATIVSLVTYLDHLALEVNQRYIQVAG